MGGVYVALPLLETHPVTASPQNDLRGTEENKMNNRAEEIINIMREKNLTLGTVESATGGLIAHLITNVPGSSDVFQGSIVAYSNAVKKKLVGVRESTLKEYGAVSAQVAIAMAKDGRKVLGVDICVADTGIAGPSGATPGKPIGLFYLGLAHQDGTFTRQFLFKGTREENKQQAAQAALMWVREYLESLK
jgi:nicotinamide-nucleotide amidase